MYRIKALRLEHGLSQRTLASKLGVSQKSVDLWEKEIIEPKSGVLSIMADIFECSIDYIVGREDESGNVNVMRELSDIEIETIRTLAKLNDTQKKEWLSYAKFLQRKEEY